MKSYIRLLSGSGSTVPGLADRHETLLRRVARLRADLRSSEKELAAFEEEAYFKVLDGWSDSKVDKARAEAGNG